MEKFNFHYISVLLDMLYGIEMDDEDVEELGLTGWELIGNKNTRLYSYNTSINSDNSITLPCNASSVESVTICGEDATPSYTNNITNTITENLIEAQKFTTNSYYNPGRLVSYEQNGNTLYFNKNYGKVNILYKGIMADEDGLPELTEKEARAIATYLAYITKYKEGLKTNNTVAINLAQNLEQKWLKQCDQARISKLSQNDMNQILNIRDSWNRHSYGYSYKPFTK